jgi:hypothetical protein
MNEREFDDIGFTEFGPSVFAREQVDQIVRELHTALLPRTLFQRALLYDQAEVLAERIAAMIRAGAAVTSHVEQQRATNGQSCCFAQVEVTGTAPFPTAHPVELSDGDPAIWVWGRPEIIHRQQILDAMRLATGARCDAPLDSIKLLHAHVIASVDVVLAVDESNDLVCLARTPLIGVVRSVWTR